MELKPITRARKIGGSLVVTIPAKMRLKDESFSLANALIINSTNLSGAKIITKDNHFKSLKEAILI